MEIYNPPRLILISGKGGVGKTTHSLALALALTKKGKKVIVVEMNSSDRIAPYFNKSPYGYKTTSLTKNLEGINLNPDDSFSEYLSRELPFSPITKPLLKNRYVTRFLNAVPGFHEIVMIGKIISLVQSEDYDHVIVDAPATGHGLSTFEVPRILNEVVRLGPLKKTAQNFRQLLEDANQCHMMIVTLPEEMPLTEASEMLTLVPQKTGIHTGPIVINSIYDSPFTDDDLKTLQTNPNFNNDHLSLRRHYSLFVAEQKKRQTEQIKNFKKLHSQTSIFTMPFIFKPLTTINDLSFLVEAWKGLLK